ncbi:MAG: fumarate hydratase [Bacteroidales bacterium]|nr:fumarate hydratase [Bacteroidales bacterium]
MIGFFDSAEHPPRYRRLEGVEVSSLRVDGHELLSIGPEVLMQLAEEAMREVAFKLRPQHLQQLAQVVQHPQASGNDRFVAHTLLRNAAVAVRGQLPLCQDTGTATVMALKGHRVLTQGDDRDALTEGIRRAYAHNNLRYSQVVPLSMCEECNSGSNLPAQIDIYATSGGAYEFLFMAKGGGSANKTALFQETRVLLEPQRLLAFLVDKIRALGTSACPPYHIAIVVGGTSAEDTLKAVKLASAKALDGLPSQPDRRGGAFRDVSLEQQLLEATRGMGYGAQFGGQHFALDVRVVRLPRHGASCPVGLGVSCVADRNIRARIDAHGVWIEELEAHPERFVVGGGGLPLQPAVRVDLRQPMPELLRQLSGYAVGTRLSLSGPIVVARDIAHARLNAALEQGQPLPEYFRKHPIYYAGPAKTPAGMASGSFGPTTAGRMDAYLPKFQQHGASLISIAKGNRSKQVTESCQRNGGFYLGSIGGAAAILAQKSIKRVELLDYPDLGMEAIYRIEVEDFPAFIIIDDKGNDFYAQL